MSIFTLHRFLSSEVAYAPVVKQLAGKIRDDELVVGLWQSILPKARAAPFFKWPGPKRVAGDELVKKIADVENYSIAEAEENVQLLGALGLMSQACQHYGIDAPRSS